MPWSRRSRRASSQPFLLFALPIALAGCVTVASTAQLPTFPPATPAPAAAVPSPSAESAPPLTAALEAPPSPTEAPAEQAAPPATSAPTATPIIAATATPGIVATATPGPTPSTAPSPAPIPVVAGLPASDATAVATEAPTRAAATDDQLDRATRRKLQRVLDNHVSNKGVAGLQAAVRLPSGEVWVGTAGSAEFTPQRAVEADTQFAIASVTKTFVAALILALVDEGRIDLDAPFGTYFGDAPRSKTATVRQLLSHTSGIYNYFANPRYGNAAKAWLRSAPTGLNSRQHKWTYDEIMGLVKGGYCKPGECYTYSNTNYVILGKVAEAVGGAPIHAQLKQRFFKPLGLDDTVYQPAQRPRTDAAHGHWKNVGSGYDDHTRDARVLPFMAAVTVADAAGAIASTARDLSEWASALYGGEVLSPESTRAMTTILRAGTYGLGTDVASFAGNRGYGHRGGLRGFESSMWHFPESGVSVVLLSNQGNWITDVPMQKLVRVALGKA